MPSRIIKIQELPAGRGQFVVDGVAVGSEFNTNADGFDVLTSISKSLQLSTIEKFEAMRVLIARAQKGREMTPMQPGISG